MIEKNRKSTAFTMFSVFFCENYGAIQFKNQGKGTKVQRGRATSLQLRTDWL